MATQATILSDIITAHARLTEELHQLGCYPLLRKDSPSVYIVETEADGCDHSDCVDCTAEAIDDDDTDNEQDTNQYGFVSRKEFMCREEKEKARQAEVIDKIKRAIRACAQEDSDNGWVTAPQIVAYLGDTSLGRKNIRNVLRKVATCELDVRGLEFRKGESGFIEYKVYGGAGKGPAVNVSDLPGLETGACSSGCERDGECMCDCCPDYMCYCKFCVAYRGYADYPGDSPCDIEDDPCLRHAIEKND